MRLSVSAQPRSMRGQCASGYGAPGFNARLKHRAPSGRPDRSMQDISDGTCRVSTSTCAPTLVGQQLVRLAWAARSGQWLGHATYGAGLLRLFVRARLPRTSRRTCSMRSATAAKFVPFGGELDAARVALKSRIAQVRLMRRCAAIRRGRVVFSLSGGSAGCPAWRPKKFRRYVVRSLIVPSAR